jgi:hypothetical protein
MKIQDRILAITVPIAVAGTAKSSKFDALREPQSKLQPTVGECR